MKDYKVYTDLRTQEEIINQLFELGYEPILFSEGCLNDTTIFVIDEDGRKKFKLGKAKFRKYIIFSYEYAGGWSNNLYILMTDNEETYQEYERLIEEEDQEEI